MSQKSILNFFKPLGEVNRPKRGFSEGPLASDKRVTSKTMFVGFIIKFCLCL